MKKVRKVFKYATGQEILKDAVYLSTQTEKTIFYTYNQDNKLEKTVEENELVWHYFLVEVSA